MNRRILYVQFADPAAYPPVEHSSEIVADSGWDVVLLGIDRNQKLKLPVDPRIRVKSLSSAKSGGRQEVQYIFFFFWSLYWICAWRPRWVYVSDPLALPALWLVHKLTGVRMIYHEHDAPNAHGIQSSFMKMVLASRRLFGRDAELCVIPQRERILEFLKTTGRKRRTICVWNCPRVREVQGNNSEQDNCLIIYYHGSINSARVPVELVVAASRFNGAVRLQIAGYEPPGSTGYVQELIKLAADEGTPGLVEFLGTIPYRKDLLRSASKAHVGLSLMPKASEDINLRHMVGASNKPFDCMACGLPLLVANLPEWTETFVEPGYARACDPADVGSIEAQLRWYIEHPDERREMGRRCADKIKRSWNYEAMFADVLGVLEGTCPNASGR